MYAILLLLITHKMIMKVQMDNLAIGSRIRKVRTTHGLKQDEFAEKLGVNRHSLSRIESGKQPVPNELLVSLWTVYKVDANFIMNGIESNEHCETHDRDIQRLIADSKDKDARIRQLDFVIEVLREKLESIK